MIEFLFQLIVLIPCIFYNNKHIILFSITFDGIFSALYFVKNFVLNNVDKKDLLKINQELYKVSILNRYLYYIFIQILYYIICIWFWRLEILLFEYLLLLTICPVCINFIGEKILHNLFNYIDKEKRKFIKIIASKQLSAIMNKVCEICIQTHPQIDYKELLFIFDDYENTVKNIWVFLKNFLLISLIHYTKNNSNVFYGKLITYFYNYKTGNLIESVDLPTAKSRFKHVIVHRQWNKLFEADILQSIIYIYSLQEKDDINFIEVFMTKLNYTIVKMFTIWSISELFHTIYVSPILSLFFLLYRKRDKLSLDLLERINFRIISLFLGYFYKNYFLISFISEVGYFLVYNKVSKNSLKYIYEKCLRISEICIHFNYYNSFFVSIFFYIECFKLIKFKYGFDYKYNLLFEILIISYLFYLITISDNFKRIMLISITLNGCISQYNIYHILYMISCSYLSLNIMHFIFKGPIEAVVDKKDMKDNKIRELNMEDVSKKTMVDKISLKPKAPLIFDEDEFYHSKKKIINKKARVIENYDEDSRNKELIIIEDNINSNFDNQKQ